MIVRSLALLASLAVSSLATAGGPQGHAAAGPAAPVPTDALAITTPELDLGHLGPSETRSFTVLLKNLNSAPVQIQGVIASCGCTAILPLQHNELAPGESVEIPITFNPHGFFGQVVKTITVRSNDPKRPEFTWNFRAYIDTPVILQPKGLGLTAYEGGDQPASTEFAFLPATKPLKVRKVWLESSAANAPKIDYKGSNGEVRGKVVLDPRTWSTDQLQHERGLAHSDKLWVELDGGYKDFILVYWTIQGIVNVVPRSLSAEIQAGQEIRFDANINSAFTFKATGATGSGPGLKATWTPGPDGRWIMLHITWTGLKPGRYAEVVTLKTDNPKFPTVAVPVAAVVH